jgi:hypothetical protein
VDRVEVAPIAVVPLSARDDQRRVRTIEAIAARPGGYIVYVDPFTYPEGGVFWTRVPSVPRCSPLPRTPLE